MSRYIYRFPTKQDGTAKAVADTLAANPGRKFYCSELAALTHKPLASVATLLCGYWQKKSHSVMRDWLSNPARPREHHRYWVPPMEGSAPASTVAAPEKKELSPLEKKIKRHFRLHHKSARPSVVAKAIKEDPKAVARELERLHRARAAHRCTLINRHGVDRHEYRLVGLWSSNGTI